MLKKDKQVRYQFLSARNSTYNGSESEGKLQETVETKSNII